MHAKYLFAACQKAHYVYNVYTGYFQLLVQCTYISFFMKCAVLYKVFVRQNSFYIKKVQPVSKRFILIVPCPPIQLKLSIFLLIDRATNPLTMKWTANKTLHYFLY